jgi:hypothetical protein
MPTFTNDNIFEYLSPNALNLQNSFIELTKKVKISIVFVLKDCNEELNYEFKSFLEKIYPHTNIYISTKKRLDGVVNSIDFLYTNSVVVIFQILQMQTSQKQKPIAYL